MVHMLSVLWGAWLFSILHIELFRSMLYPILRCASYALS